MTGARPTDRAGELAARLKGAASDFVAAIESIDAHRWRLVPEPGVWSVGKDAEHVADAAGYHLWIVRRTIGDEVSSRHPALERKSMTTDLSPGEAAAIIRQRTEDGVRLILALTEAQLDLPTRPPRANGQLLADTIDRVMIGHYDAHRAAIEEKLPALRRIDVG